MKKRCRCVARLVTSITCVADMSSPLAISHWVILILRRLTCGGRLSSCDEPGEPAGGCWPASAARQHHKWHLASRAAQPEAAVWLHQEPDTPGDAAKRRPPRQDPYSLDQYSLLILMPPPPPPPPGPSAPGLSSYTAYGTLNFQHCTSTSTLLTK